MTRSDVELELSQLQGALQRLAQITLPQMGGTALIEARQHLQTLTRMLDEQRKSARLEMLYRVSQSISASLELEEVFNRVMDAVIELTGAEHGYILLLDPDTQQIEVAAARALAGADLAEADAAFSRTVLRTVVEQDAGLLTTDARVDPRFAGQESVILNELRSILCAPLRWRGQVRGVLYVDHRLQEGAFQDADLELLEAFALQAAAAIENARLYTQTGSSLNERVAELEILAQIDRQLNATLDLAQVAGITLDWAVRGASADGGWLALGEQADQDLTIITGARSGEKVFSADPQIAEAWQRASTCAYAPTTDRPAMLIAPILRGGKPVGVIVLERSRLFTDSACQFLSRLAGHASIALDNARLHQAVQQANQAKSKFVSVVVHELRIPMTAIKGYADLLRQGAVGPVNDAQLNFLDVIRNNVSRMAALVSDLSDLNRVESGRLKLEPAEISLFEVVQEVVKSLGPKIAEKNQSLQVEVSADLPRIYADPQRVNQVFANLLNNAWKYTPEGGLIQVRAAQSTLANGTTGLRLTVTDNGIGISEEDQASLFTPFFRSDAAAVREQQGWGLGLSVARSLIDVMGGEIGVSTSLDHGSTFWFFLPLQMDENPGPQAFI